VPMDAWGIALIAAGSALVGSWITGWFTRSAGSKQAEAARHAGDRQADALLDTVRRTLDQERVLRALDQRRQTYVGFLQASEAVSLTRRTGRGQPDDESALHQACASVELEGPAEVERAARGLVEALRRNRPLDDVDLARADFVRAARAALVVG
jgi:hypothetical protein